MVNIENNQVLITFENKLQADRFIGQLSNSGEQEYFDAIEVTGDEGVNSFTYENNLITGKNVG